MKWSWSLCSESAGLENMIGLRYFTVLVSCTAAAAVEGLGAVARRNSTGGEGALCITAVLEDANRGQILSRIRFTKRRLYCF